ncbi:MAG: hypothetical protein SFU25_12170 [Candidatus Caenarcaniphilales bacterium]|nr:hypothetical protein [Candidatus Caenarcaniphilales bacterium]
MNNNKKQTTFDRWMKNPKVKEEFDKEYEELLLSELVLAIMESDEISVGNMNSL